MELATPLMTCYAIWYLEVSLWYCTVAPVGLFTQDRNYTEGLLGPMWSSPNCYRELDPGYLGESQVS